MPEACASLMPREAGGVDGAGGGRGVEPGEAGGGDGAWGSWGEGTEPGEAKGRGGAREAMRGQGEGMKPGVTRFGIDYTKALPEPVYQNPPSTYNRHIPTTPTHPQPGTKSPSAHPEVGILQHRLAIIAAAGGRVQLGGAEHGRLGQRGHHRAAQLAGLVGGAQLGGLLDEVGRQGDVRTDDRRRRAGRHCDLHGADTALCRGGGGRKGGC